MNNKYDDIINLPHHKSKVHPCMPIKDRAAQFSAFASLKGYEDAVKETARLTHEQRELDDNKKSELNEKLTYILENIKSKPAVAVTYYVPDKYKAGGEYYTETGIIRKIDTYQNKIVLENNLEIPISRIFDLKIS